jgi:tRNA (cmo5U34)-methyltransferase
LHTPASRSAMMNGRLWLSRYVAYAVDSGMPRDKAESARTAMDAQLFILTPGQDESVLRDAGFSHTSLFYTGFAFRGWVAYA